MGLTAQVLAAGESARSALRCRLTWRSHVKARWAGRSQGRSASRARRLSPRAGFVSAGFSCGWRARSLLALRAPHRTASRADGGRCAAPCRGTTTNNAEPKRPRAAAARGATACAPAARCRWLERQWQESFRSCVCGIRARAAPCFVCDRPTIVHRCKADRRAIVACNASWCGDPGGGLCRRSIPPERATRPGVSELT